MPEVYVAELTGEALLRHIPSVRWERQGSIAVLWVRNGPVNALDGETLEALSRCLAEIEGSDARAVVLTGEGPTFSAGADIKRVLDEGPEYIDRRAPVARQAFRDLFLFPRPVVAAVNGAAVAGGLVLACACDYRLAAADAKPIGFAELRVGVPFPATALEIVRFAVPNAERLILTAKLFAAEEALTEGLVHEVVDPGSLMERASMIAERMGSVIPATYAVTKRAFRAPVAERIDASSAYDEEAKRLWTDPKVRDSMKHFLNRLAGS